MNNQDIVNALRCLRRGENLNLAVLKHQDIPYVKRYLLQNLGQPNRMIENKLFYPELTITVRSVLYNNMVDLPRGLRGTIFYVEYKNGEDEEELKKHIPVQELPVRSVELWKSMGLDFYSMYKSLLVDGYSAEEAISILKYTNMTENL